MLSLSRIALSSSLIISASILPACKDETSTRTIDPTAAITQALPPLSKIMPCLRDHGPILALHRGRDKSKSAPENSLLALREVFKAGYIMAEVDVAGLKDDTLILFHDGVWDEKTTGRGPVAATDYAQASKFLLTTKRGVSSERVARFDDVLSYAKGRLYLEIDFKSSADEADVINAIKSADMQGQVVLIGYSLKQARRLHRRLPEAMVSAPIKSAGDLRALGAPKSQVLAWAGTKQYDASRMARLRGLGIKRE
jgi:glycerophosphoryl diester phosphodiesterase